MPAKKKVAALVKVALNAASATPAPPVGTALGPHGVNIMEFVKAYNAATESMRGTVIPVEITIYEDRSFTFVTKTPPAAELIKKAAGVPKMMVYAYDLAAPGDVAEPFLWSAVMTGVAFLVVGGMKSRFVDQTWWRSALETLAVGGLAAALAYAAGAFLQGVT